jgi:CHASE2 domain-containing sensor protein
VAEVVAMTDYISDAAGDLAEFVLLIVAAISAVIAVVAWFSSMPADCVIAVILAALCAAGIAVIEAVRRHRGGRR